MSAPERRTLQAGAVQMDDYGTVPRKTSDKTSILQHDDLQTGFDEKLLSGSTSYYDNKECFFKDGIRKIDYILVYDEDIHKVAKKSTSLDDSQTHIDKDKHTMFRQNFIINVKAAGIVMEEETAESNKNLIHYIKLHVPWDVLCVNAEDLMMRAKLQLAPNKGDRWSAKVLQTLRIPNIMKLDIPREPPDYNTCQFKRSKLHKFIGSENKDTFFEDRDRQRVAYEILAKTIYGEKDLAEIGIDRLVEEDVYTAAFPLHCGTYEVPEHFQPDQLNDRQILYQYWARWGAWYKYQPLDHIRNYFGEKIGIYFAWLGFYTAWLLPASIVGVFVFIYGVATMHLNTVATETCDTNVTYLMCPLCDGHCNYWNLSDVCYFTKIASLFDHPGTMFYAIFMSFWAVTFLENWKRKTASLAYQWDCMDFEDEEERPRPEYAAKCKITAENPITGIKEPHFPPRDRLPRIISGLGVLIMMMCLVIIFIFAVIIYRLIIAVVVSTHTSDPLIRNKASTVASVSAAIVNLIIIMLLGRVYETLARRITEWEMHRTQTEFEDQLIFKVFIFQFVNFYSSIIYIGFVKGKFTGYPGHYAKTFGYRQEECDMGGCLMELAVQLIVIMIGKQAINNCQELIVPKAKQFFHMWKMGKTVRTLKTRWEEDYEMVSNEGLFEEYLEMVLQFGFITIFVAAFPLAPLFALLNNWMEIRLDAHKFVCETRRPVAERGQDIGVWFSILDALAQLAVISNAFLIAFTSDFLPKMLYMYDYDETLTGYVNFSLSWATPNETNSGYDLPCRYKGYRDIHGEPTRFLYKLMCVRLAFIIVFEHVVFGVCKLIDIVVPDVPESLEIKIKRERYLAKQALADVAELQK